MIEELDLTGQWTVWRKDKPRDTLPATVPGSIHTDLMNADKIPDPFYRDNENNLMWIGESDWVYERTFSVDAELLEHDRVFLRCDGLDTLATIELNGREVAATKNMFRTYEFDVRDSLQPGENTIRVTFDSALEYGQRRQKEDRYMGGAGENHPEKLEGGSWVRKEPCNFGWDWGPQCVTCGIWRPIKILGFSTARIDDVHIRQDHNPDVGVNLNINLTTETSASVDLQANVTVMFEGDQVAEDVIQIGEQDGLSSLSIEDPKLWWPNNMGPQNLYDVIVELTDTSGNVFDRDEKRIGLRRLELVREPDEWGESFHFTVNGVPFYAKGANWIPADVFQTRVTDERYRDLLESAAAAHMNMIRVWGGGIYENDSFYELCDELGLCVWQDFMFACAEYPIFDPDFKRNVEQEFIDNIRRLRHHPCIALWCGNNELEQIGSTRDEAKEEVMSWPEYCSLFDQLIPQVLGEEDPDRPYWPSSEHSPIGDRTDSTNPNWGDAHLWAVWHGKKPFEWYRTTTHRFCSEFGFQSFPEPLTVASYTEPQDRNVTAPVMEHHQRSGIGNQTIMHYMLSWYRLPVGFENTLWLSQIQQGLAIKFAVEHWRRNMPRCMGALYWQLNDCWPVASWASIDSFGRWKALHYMAKRFFAPVLISGVEKPDEENVEIHLTSDRLKASDLDLKVTITDCAGNELCRETMDFRAPANDTSHVDTLDLSPLLESQNQNDILVWLEASEDGELLSSNLVTFVHPKSMPLQDPQLETTVERDGDGFYATVTCNSPALWTWLSDDETALKCSDNFFCLAPWQERRVRITPEDDLQLDDLRSDLRARSLIDTYTENE